jgi:UDP-glucose 4-epimerase
MRWLLTGGAGYIGSHVAHALVAAGVPVVVLDDLSSGDLTRLPPEVAFVHASVCDESTVRETLERQRPSGVIHLAARKAVSESVADPITYYRDNVGGMISLLSAMAATGVNRLVYSSSASVYGTSAGASIREDAPTDPVNPYGRTKLVGEWLIRDAALVSELQFVSLRYFNVVGAAAPALGDLRASNLVPLVFQALSRHEPPLLFGEDHPTADGSCIRDYVHVVDVAQAHVQAAQRLTQGGIRATYNVGRGLGYSVKEVFQQIRHVIGVRFEPRVIGRRPGDAAYVTACVDRVHRELGWSAKHDLNEMIRSAWEAWNHQQRPG